MISPPFTTLRKCRLLSPQIRQILREKIGAKIQQGQKIFILCKPSKMGVATGQFPEWGQDHFLIARLDGDFDVPEYVFRSKMSQKVADQIDPDQVEIEDWGGQDIALIYTYTPDLVREMQTLNWVELCPSCWSVLEDVRQICEEDFQYDECGECGWRLDPVLIGRRAPD